ncbi:N-acetylglucosamine-6-phosphate deacetylase (plasmid) [Pseudoalteromonas sp. HL-AS2]|uniref:N-acetylgalactosamine-6-phosphate deacetylase n=1 Tax=Pseudoalteromonas translucida KMM 520 TaxID=1315283 RepID=A0A0U2X7V4_9GAMM|nr:MULTISPECIES: N-acetylglucosamine-6-phosphate deacetylase [Pseudoalteromonas]ALS34738.1 N-acetylglucosamine-6-phosphate deacetylase [Pseudoalteromonas translucida KMM 520]MBH0092231.1 N-acetylglucosamine-6-phosphate deacetylase [Pseudoalteromonas sp. SCQQ13]MBO7927532.1 N-acetylglucosamine-6-phosphate deacetylase [Pseudoalteromonas sp. K222D]WMS96163.1 N-acetylglucosamine-6-phosphate deacetylase [Pseudoalteromonas sp. HL-AS2]
MITTLIADHLFDGKTLHSNHPISIKDGKIIAFDTVKGAIETKVSGLLTAGFIDTQVNGGGGCLLNQNTNLQTLTAMSTAHAKYGTSSLLPTLITSNLNKIEQTANLISTAIAQHTPGILGVHFEGPHISEPKKGIHSSQQIRGLSQQELDIYCRDDLGIKIVTLAPENVSCETIKILVDHGVHVCLGHSNASFEQAQAALAAGATGFTHLFNAMSALESRAPNMVGAALLDEQSWCGIILDGHHVHPSTAKLAYRAKAARKMMLVTDSMSTIGSEQTQLHFDGHDINLVGDKLTSNSGQLAGSALNMITAVNNATHMLDISLTDALNMASLYPAEFLGIEGSRGQLSIGANADLTLLSTTNSSPRVLNTWIGGKAIF